MLGAVGSPAQVGNFSNVEADSRSPSHDVGENRRYVDDQPKVRPLGGAEAMLSQASIPPPVLRFSTCTSCVEVRA